MKIGVLSYRFSHYSYRRNVLFKLPDAEYLPVDDVFSITNRLVKKANSIFGRPLLSNFNLNNIFYDASFNNVDLLHLFNGISYGQTPWVSTFETLLPRFDFVLQNHRKVDHLLDLPGHIFSVKRAFEALSGKSCLKLIAMSKCALGFEMSLLNKFPEFKQAILPKLTFLHPPQPVEVESFSEKGVELNGPVRFMLVGGEFFRKAGVEIVETLHMLRSSHRYPIELIVVSSLRTDDYVSSRSLSDVQYVQQLFQDNADWIRYYPSLPNAEVMRLMKTSHVGLLPTYADSFGYSVLEFQSMGVPVITTNIRALPEINNDQVGWVIEVPKDDLGEGLYGTEEERRTMSDRIRKGLETHVHAIFQDLTVIETKGNLSIDRIRKEHDPAAFSRTLRDIYEQRKH